ncbi:VOC family protein [Rhodococcus sp. NPDC058521]|uniref:VOC family protein n=1 Tax=Rhodococcus sp. NPDC058521 TaxID=3346536 RepID=UPI00366431E3
MAAGPVIVDDLAATTAQLVALGSDIVVPQTHSETGTFTYLRHHDGSIVEYLQWTPQLIHSIIGP